MNLALLLGLALCLCCLIFSRSKVVFYLTLFYIWILFAGAYGHADYFASEVYYNNCLNTSVGVEDPLSGILQKVFFRFGFSYQEFLAITSAVLLLMLATLVRRMTSNIGVVLGLYFISPMSLDVVQYNNFAGMVFALFAFQYLLKERRSLVKFFIFMGLATGICSYCVVYFAFLLVFLDIKLLCKIMLVAVPLIAVAPTAVLYIAQRFVNVEKVKVYFSKVNKQETMIALEVIVILCVLLIVLLAYNAKKGKFVKTYGAITSKRITHILKINIIMLITVALQMYTLESARFYRNVFVLDYIAVSYLRYIKIGIGDGKHIGEQTKATMTGNKMLRTSLYEFAMLIAAVAYSYLYTVHWNLTSVFIPVFEDNLFFGWF
jgi:hypothetical protein